MSKNNEPKTSDKKDIKVSEVPIQRYRINLMDFLHTKPELKDSMHISGFKAYTQGKEWMYVDEWEQVYKEYTSRGK
jgi:hypothetical protein